MTARKLASGLAIRPDESGLVLPLVMLFAITQMSHAVGANSADALFFVRFGVGDLPLMIAVSGVAVMIVTLLHGLGLARRGPRRWLWLAASASALWAGLGWASTWLGQTWAYAVIWVSTQVIIWVTFTMMWNGAESACNTRQAKRLFPLFAAGGILGGVAGNLLSGPAASLFGTEQLLLAQALLLAGSAVLFYRIRHLFADHPATASPSLGADLRAAVATVRSSRLLMLAAATALLMSVLFFFVVFPFNEAVASAFGSEAQVAGYLGVFSSIAAAATFLFSLLVTKRLFARVGIVLALVAVPVVYLAGFSLWLASFGLAAAALVRGAQWVAVNAIGLTAYAALFNVVPSRRRGQVMTFMTAVPAQVGTVVAGLALIAGSAFSRQSRFGTGLVLAIGLLVIVMAMRPAYYDAVVAAVRHGLVGVLAVPQRGLVTPVDADARRVLLDHLDDARAETRALALSALAHSEDESSASQIEPFLADESPLVRVTAFDSMSALNHERILEQAQTLITDPAHEMRLRVLAVLASAGEPEHLAIITEALNDPHPRVAAAAAAILGGEVAMTRIAGLLATQESKTVGAVLEEMARARGSLVVDPTPYLVHSDRHIRAVAAAAYPFWRRDPAQLLPGLDDPALWVRRASAQALAQFPEGRRLLEGVLESGTVRATDEALRAITPMETLEPRFIRWASQEARRASRLRTLKAALVSASPTPTLEYLVRVVGARSARLERWVLMAVTTAATWEVMPIVERGLRSNHPETRANAVEAMEMTGDRGALAILMPLLEWSPNGPVPDPRSALRDLLSDFDPWLRALATRCLAEEIATDLAALRDTSAQDQSVIVRSALPVWSHVTTERYDTLNPMDRVMALHRVPMFSELDPEDLELIAKGTEEVRFEANEPIYQDGAEASEMLVIVEGNAVVSKNRNSAREVIQIYGSGEHVGELALLSGGVRSADVSAGEQGLHGIVVTKDDLLSILEERPAVALGMLTILAKRLSEQTSNRASPGRANSSELGLAAPGLE
ncbi:MAG: cyclic nucleotide-binding domain-containing protein [Acidimicrobiia bacterium]